MKPAILFLFAVTALSAQTVEGDVFDALTGAPVAGALVSINTGSADPAVVRTDAIGHFSLPAPTGFPGFSVQVTRAGFLRAQRSVTDKPGRAASGLRVELTPAAVISGKLLDEDGFPVEKAQVAALRYQAVNGERKLQPVPLSRAQSDDLGEYRIFGLPAGRYCIRASSGDLANWDRRYVPEYLPGVLEPADESWIEVKAGQERGGVNLRFTKHEGVTVEGRIAMAPGVAAPQQIPFVWLRDSQFAIPGYITGSQPRDGTFRITHVPPGTYNLRAQSGNSPPKAGDSIAEQQLQVGNADVRDVVLTFREVKPVDIDGAVVLEGGGAPRPMIINLRATFGPGATARSNDEGTFTLNNLLPGHYDVQVMPDFTRLTAPITSQSLAGAGHPVSVRLGEKEVLQAGFDLDGTSPGSLRITLSTRVYTVTGTLLDAAGKPVSGAVVAIESGQPTGRSLALTDADGVFQLYPRSGGDFHIYVVADQNQTGSLSDPDYLKAHEKDFAPLRIFEGQNPPLTLRLPVR